MNHLDTKMLVVLWDHSLRTSCFYIFTWLQLLKCCFWPGLKNCTSSGSETQYFLKWTVVSCVADVATETVIASYGQTIIVPCKGASEHTNNIVFIKWKYVSIKLALDSTADDRVHVCMFESVATAGGSLTLSGNHKNLRHYGKLNSSNVLEANDTVWNSGEA